MISSDRGKAHGSWWFLPLDDPYTITAEHERSYSSARTPSCEVTRASDGRHRMMRTMKRISTGAYQALRNALPAVTWYKRPFESLLRTALRDHPELLGSLDFSDTKRNVADQLVGRLVAQEDRYLNATIQLMLELAAMNRFPDVERLTEPDRSNRLAEAQKSVAALQEITREFAGHQEERARLQAEREAGAARAAVLRKFSDEIDELKERFNFLSQSGDPQQRGRDFELLLSDLFKLFDMEPRTAYSTANEQIDGSLSFGTDDYLLEAKWLNVPVSREAVDAFAAKVQRKGKNALGVFVAVSGFSRPALDTYKESTPFITLDGTDLYLVLDGRLRLDDLLKAKKRHANETGSCFLSASSFVADL